MKKATLPAILFVIVAVGAMVYLYMNRIPATPASTAENEDIVLYYGEGCPHCANVDQFISDNDLHSKISFPEKEVFYNQANGQELAQRAAACGLPTDSIGVPFLWDGHQCYVGDVDIINFFKSKIGQ